MRLYGTPVSTYGAKVQIALAIKDVTDESRAATPEYMNSGGG